MKCEEEIFQGKISPLSENAHKVCVFKFIQGNEISYDIGLVLFASLWLRNNNKAKDFETYCYTTKLCLNA